MQKEWIIREHDEGAATEIAHALEIHPITAQIITNRGINTVKDALSYMEPSLNSIPDPFQFPDMDISVQRIAKAVKSGEKIAIFGDYDVDGITATALLYLFFKEIGCDPYTILPDRDGGYGLTDESVKKIHKSGSKLLITVDNGIRAIDAIKLAGDLGIDTIITDHHEIGEEVPSALAIINPHRLDKEHDFRNLSGCGVAFILLLALRKYMRDEGLFKDAPPNLKRHLDLVALGTIADVVSLQGVNRTLVKFGIAEIAFTRKPGIRALIEISGTRQEDINPGSIAFRLAPRLNAAGRMGAPDEALNLLISEDYNDAVNRAKGLDLINRKRQKIEQKILNEMQLRLKKDTKLSDKNTIVLHSDGWHLGIIGITAAKITEQNLKPTIIISLDSNPPRGSARSIEGINLMDALSQCEDLLVSYGGHAMAAGLSIKPDRIEEFIERFDDACRKIKPSTLVQKIKIDACVEPADITERLVEEIELLNPFGIGNPEPLLVMNGVSILDRRVVGDNHLKMTIGDGKMNYDSIAFGMAKSIDENLGTVQAAFVPKFNHWKGRRSIQLKIKDIQKCTE